MNQSLNALLKNANFQEKVNQEKTELSVQTEGQPSKVTYIQSGELWFATLCINSSILLVVFLYAILCICKLYDKRGTYEKVLFQHDSVQIVGLASDEEEEEEDDDEQMTTEDRPGPSMAVLEHILPTLSCIMYIACLLSLVAHCLLRVLFSYEVELQDRTSFTFMQIFLSVIALIASTLMLFIYRRQNKAHPADTACLSATSQVLLYRLQWEGIWGMHVVCTANLFDDILTLVAVRFYNPDSKDGISLTNLIYIWLGLFTVYIILLFLLDLCVNNDVLILAYLSMLFLLCEIPIRNYKAMNTDPASLGTSGIGLLVLVCLSVRLVYVLAYKGFQCVQHVKFD